MIKITYMLDGIALFWHGRTLYAINFQSMEDTQVGHHIPSAVNLVAVVQRPAAGPAPIHLLDTEASPVPDWVLPRTA